MLEMTDQRVKQLAMSRNHQAEGDKKVAYMSIAYTETTLTESQVDGLMGKYAYRSWFNINGETKEPMEWTGAGESIVCKKAFKDVSATFKLDKQELEFDGCRLYVDHFKLLNNGDVLIDWHLHVMDASDSEWIAIGRAEYTELLMSLGDGVLIERKTRKQRELPLEGGSDIGGDAETEQGANGATTPLDGSHLAAVTTGQLDTPVRDETHVYWMHGESHDLGNGPRSDMPEGCVEIDPPQGSKSEAEQLSQETVADSTKTPEEIAADAEAFRAGLAESLGARTKRGSNVIDGRSERVKHQDRQRGRDSVN